MAGPLFSEGEVNQRLLEYELLTKHIEQYNINDKVFTPILAPQNDKSKLPTAVEIFEGDNEELQKAEVIFADLTNADPGVMMELGMVLDKDKKIYAYLSDIRMETAGKYEGQYVPWGYNQFVIGALERYGYKIHHSFNEAFEAYLVDLEQAEPNQ